MNRLSVGVQTLKDLLGRPQEEIRKMLLKTKKEDPCYIVAESLAKLLPTVIWERKFINWVCR